jgi:hypothetical protein
MLELCRKTFELMNVHNRKSNLALKCTAGSSWERKRIQGEEKRMKLLFQTPSGLASRLVRITRELSTENLIVPSLAMLGADGSLMGLKVHHQVIYKVDCQASQRCKLWPEARQVVLLPLSPTVKGRYNFKCNMPICLQKYNKATLVHLITIQDMFFNEM